MSAVGDYLLSLPDDTLDKLLKNGRTLGRANSINEDSNEDLRRAHADYKRVRERTIEALDDLNKRKIKVLGGEISRFVDAFQRVRNINFNECKGLTKVKNVEFTKPDYDNMSNEIAGVHDFIISGMKTYAFGGIILGAVVMGRKAKISLNNAKANAAGAKIEIEKLETEKVELDAIRKLAKQEDKIIRKLTKISNPAIAQFENLVMHKTDWNDFNVEEKQLVASLMSLMKLIKLIADQPVINENGDICNEAYNTVEHEEIAKLTQKGD